MLMTVRSWAERVGIETRSPECVRKQELGVRLGKKRTALDELENDRTAGHQFYFALLDKLKGDIHDLEKELDQ